MITHFLGDQEVTSYAKDLAQRLASFEPEDFPTIWCPIGKSGDKMVRVVASELGKIDPSLVRDVATVELFYDKQRRVITLGERHAESDLKDANVLVLDSSIHSGGSMLNACRFVEACGCKKAISYSLTVKQSSSFLPHYFGVLVGDHDRVLFQLDAMPNNRLFSRKYKPVGIFRRIAEIDAQNPQPTLKTGLPSLDKISLGDLYYEHRANGYDVILVEDKQNIAGFLKIKASSRKQLQVDVIASDDAYKGKGIGGALMRYAETIGRANCCTHIELWSIEKYVEWYEKFGFEKSGERIDAGGGEIYWLMKKRLLYHFDMRHDDLH